MIFPIHFYDKSSGKADEVGDVIPYDMLSSETKSLKIVSQGFPKTLLT